MTAPPESRASCKGQEEMGVKMKEAQEGLVARLRVEPPKIMDNSIKQRAPLVQKQLEQRGINIPKP